MEAQNCAEELLWVVVLFLVECGNARGMTVACIILTCTIVSQKMLKRRKQGKVGKKNEENQLKSAQLASALFLFLLQCSLWG